MNRPTILKGLQLSFRAAVGASLALMLAEWLHLEFPIYAFLAAVIVTDLSPVETRRLGWRRVVATVVGATCGAVLSQLLPSQAWAVGVGVLITMLLCHVVHMQEGARVGGYICGIIQLAYGSEPWSYAWYRLAETMLGVGVAWGISQIPKLVRIEDSDHAAP